MCVPCAACFTVAIGGVWERLRASLGALQCYRLTVPPLYRERERLRASQAEVGALQASQADLQADLDGCHAKEADLLDFTQKLTAKNVELQSQISGFQARVRLL